MSPAAPQPVELGEWETRELEGAVLSASDRDLAERLGTQQGGRLLVEELRSGVRISARSWVGLVRFDAFEVRVAPKLAGDHLNLVRMIEYTTGLDALRRLSAERRLAARAGGLLDLIALLLVEATEAIVRGGLLRDYVEREEELPVVRGRLLADRQFLERFGRVDVLICRHDELEQDVAENQLLAVALSACGRLVSDEDVRRRARQLFALLREVCDPESIDLADARRSLFYHRLNEHYREAHELAWLVLDGLGIEDVLATGPTRSFAFLIDMNLLFERFVHRLLSELLAGSGVRVHYQRRDRSIIWDEGARRPYSTVIPDLLLEVPEGAGARRFPIDAKYKLYDERHVSPGDIYQAFLYAYAYGRQGAADVPASAIVYPSTTGGLESRRLGVRSADGLRAAQLSLLGIPLARVLGQLRGSVDRDLRTALLRAIQRTAGAVGTAAS